MKTTRSCCSWCSCSCSPVAPDAAPPIAAAPAAAASFCCCLLLLLAASFWCCSYCCCCSSAASAAAPAPSAAAAPAAAAPVAAAAFLLLVLLLLSSCSCCPWCACCCSCCSFGFLLLKTRYPYEISNEIQTRSKRDPNPPTEDLGDLGPNRKWSGKAKRSKGIQKGLKSNERKSNQGDEKEPSQMKSKFTSVAMLFTLSFSETTEFDGNLYLAPCWCNCKVMQPRWLQLTESVNHKPPSKKQTQTTHHSCADKNLET